MAALTLDAEQIQTLQKLSKELGRMKKTVDGVLGEAAPQKAKKAKGEKRESSPWAQLCAALIPRTIALYKSTYSENPPQGFPMKVCGYLKSQGESEEVSDAQIVEAIEYLQANPEHKSKTQKSRAASEAGSVASKKAKKPANGGAGAPAPKPAKKAAKKVAPPASDSESEEEEKPAPKPVKKAPKKVAPPPPPAPESDSESEEEEEKPAPKPQPKKAAPPPAPETDSEDEAEESGSESEEDEEPEPWYCKKMDKMYLKNQLNQVWEKNADGSRGSWVGVWNPKEKELNTAAPEPEM